MDAALALFAAFLFAVAATLQQKGALNLPKVSLTDPSSLLKLIGQTMWLIGTVALLCGYVAQAIALDHGRLSIIQPLLVTTVVFALPLGYWLTDQHVGPKEIVGAAVIMAGLALFTVLADPAGGNENAPDAEWVIVIVLITIASAVLLYFGGRDGADPGTRAAVYGTVAGMLFGLSAALTKPTLTFLSDSVSTMLSNWQPYVLAIAGIGGFVLQQVSLGTGRLAPGCNRVDRQPGGRHPDRHALARRDLESADVAHRRRRDRSRGGARRRGGHLTVQRSQQEAGRRSGSNSDDVAAAIRQSPALAPTASTLSTGSSPATPAGPAPSPTGPCKVSVNQAIRSRITSRPGCGGHVCTVDLGRSNTMCFGSPAS